MLCLEEIIYENKIPQCFSEDGQIMFIQNIFSQTLTFIPF